MDDGDTLFRCTLERRLNGTRETKIVEIWAGWPGIARESVAREWVGWKIVGVEADFSKP